MRRGLIRSFGVSDFNVYDLIHWRRAERRVGLSGSVACNQVKYCTESRDVESVTLPWQRARCIQTMAYWPLGRLGNASLASDPVLTQIGQERDATAAQVALAWCTRGSDVVAIPKSTDLRRLEENYRAGQLVLTPGELQRIDSAFPPRHRRLAALHQCSPVHRVRAAMKRQPLNA
jgi:diketogulonate reductase-like aldo/keto reductase